MARKTPTLTAPGHIEEDTLRFDDAPEFMDSPHNLDNVDMKVKEAQEQLLQLRMQQEEIERQKLHLEALRVKQERFIAGKRDLLEKIGRSTSSVERDLYDAQKRVEELSITHDDFCRHFEILKSLQPEKWHRSQVDEELDHALAAIEDAEADYSKGSRRLETLRVVETAPVVASVAHSAAEESQNESVSFSTHSEDLIVWLRRGFAFTLPLMGALFVGLLLAKMMF